MALQGAELDACIQQLFGCTAGEFFDNLEALDPTPDVDTNTTYDLVPIDNPDGSCTIRLIDSDLQIVGEKTIQTYDESFTWDPDASTITFTDDDGTTTVVPIPTDTDTFAVAGFATEAGVDDYGNPVAVGDTLVTLADGTKLCVPGKADADTFGTIVESSPGNFVWTSADGNTVLDWTEDDDSIGSIATEPGTALNGPYSAGDVIVTLDSGQVICVTKTTAASAVACDDSALPNPYRPLTIDQGHAPNIFVPGTVGCLGFAEACKPPAPSCPILGMTAHTDPGLTWQWDGNDWILVNFRSLGSQRDLRAASVPPAMNSAYFAANAGAGLQNLDTLCVTIDNDDCVPWAIKGRVRQAENAQLAWSPGFQTILTQINLDTTGTTLGAMVVDGTSQQVYTTNNDGPGFDRDNYGQKNILWRSNQLVLPGQSFDVCFTYDANVLLYTSTSAANFITSGAFTMVVEIERACQ